MSGLFNSLHIGQSSIFANQKNMSVLGNNVANANTEGYSRQEVQMEAWPTIQRGDLSFGQGVKVGDIARAHDRFITDRLRDTSEEYGQAEGKATPLTELERIIGIDENSLAGSIDDFFDAWQELTVNPKGEAERTLVLRQGEALATRFRQTENSLSGLEDSIDSRLETELKNVNDKLQQIADLNQRITQATSTGHNPNTALDDRDRLLQELSQELGSKVYINDKGAASVYLPNGPTLVQDNQAYQILAGKQATDGLQFTLKSGKTETSLPSRSFGGEFKGYIDVRDKILPEVKAGLDQLQHDLIIQVNAKHSAGVNLEGETGLNFFQPVSSYQSDGFALDDDGFADADNLQLTVDGTPTDVEIAATDTLEDIRDKINDQVDGVLASVVQDENDDTYRLKVVPAEKDATVEVNTENLNSTSNNLVDSGNVFATVDGHAALQVSLDEPEEISAGRSDAPGDNQTALEIAELRDAQVAGSSKNATFVDAYGKISSDVGVEVKQNEFDRESLRDTLNQLENRRDEVAGVSIDESMIDLQRYQRAFQASAQFVTTVDEMLQTLLSIKR
jgi:flagellar hook-associated protein 1 FlgK